MKNIIATFICMVLSFTGFGQMVAGNAGFIIEVEETLLVNTECQANSQGEALNPHNNQSLEIDLFDDGSIDIEFYSARTYQEYCKFYYRTAAIIDGNNFRVCGFYQSDIPVLYEKDDTLSCEDSDHFWLHSSFRIGYKDWFSNSLGFLNAEKKYIYFESLNVDSLKGWILVSTDVPKTELVVHRIGLNKEIPFSIFKPTSKEPEDNVLVFPNPCNEILNVDLGPSNFGVAKVKIYHLSDGKVVYEQIHDVHMAQLLTIETSSLYKGNYLIWVEFGNQTYTKKFSKY